MRIDEVKLTPLDVQRLTQLGVMKFPDPAAVANEVKQAKRELSQKRRDANKAKGLRSDGRPMKRKAA